MMRVAKVLLLLLFPLCVCSGGNVVLEDNLSPSLVRVWHLQTPSGGEQQIKITKSKGTFLFRGCAKLSEIAVLSADGSTVIWKQQVRRANYGTPMIPAGDFILRAKALPGAVGSVEVSCRDGRGQRMISWYLENSTGNSLPEGGAILRSTGTGRLGGRCYVLNPKKEYLVNFKVQGNESQTIKIYFGWRDPKTRRMVYVGHDFRVTAGRESECVARLRGFSGVVNMTLWFKHGLTIRSLTIKEADDVPETVRDGNQVLLRQNRFFETDPANPGLKNVVFYQREPRFVYRKSVPQPHEIVSQVYTFAAKNSVASFYGVLHNPGNAAMVGPVKVSDLRMGDKVIPADKWEISMVGFADFPRGKHWVQNIPELLLDQEPSTLGAGENRMFRFRLKLPEKTAPGLYTATVTLPCGGKEIKVPLQVKVLDFDLIMPTDDEFVWSVYSREHCRPQRFYRPELRFRYFQDMRDGGIGALHIMAAMTESTAIKIQNIRKAHGFTGPVIIYASQHRTVLNRLGLPYNKRWFDNEKVRNEMVSDFRKFAEYMKKYGGPGYENFYFQCIDEPQLGHMEQAKWELKLARQGGLKTSGTVYQPGDVATLAPYLDLSVNLLIDNDPQTYAALKEVQQRYPHLKFWYLGAGAYDNQEGGLMPNRLQAGFACFRLGVTGHMSYAYQNYTAEGSPFRQPLKRFYGMTYPHPKPTPQRVTVEALGWDGLQEGIIDYCYLHTLKKLIDAKAARYPAQTAAAKLVLQQITERASWRYHMVHAEGITDRRDFTNDTAIKLRAMAALAIVDLMESTK